MKNRSLLLLKLSSIFFFLFVLLLAIACERETVPQANKQAVDGGGPSYDVLASVSVLPGNDNVSEVAPKMTTKEAIDPQALYLTHCSACHMATGQGISGAFPPLANSPYVLSDNTERMAAIMVYGLVGPIKVLGVQYVGAMAPLGTTLNDEELAAIGTYIRNSWGHSASPVQPQLFSKVREKYGSRGPFNIQELGEEPN